MIRHAPVGLLHRFQADTAAVIIASQNQVTRLNVLDILRDEPGCDDEISAASDTAANG